MRRDNSPPTTTAEPETDPSAATASEEADWITAEEQSEGAISLVDPLFYAPLLLVGAALVVFPDPVTTVVGVGCFAAGLVLAAVDLLSLSTDTE